MPPSLHHPCPVELREDESDKSWGGRDGVRLIADLLGDGLEDVGARAVVPAGRATIRPSGEQNMAQPWSGCTGLTMGSIMSHVREQGPLHFIDIAAAQALIRC